MRNWKKIADKILFPSVWLIMILTVVSAIALAVIFGNGWESNPAACAGYVTAFYTLTVICMFFSKVLSRYYRRMKVKLHEN